MFNEYEEVLRRRLKWKVFDDILILFFFIFLSLVGCDGNTNNYILEDSEQQYWKVCIDGKEFIEGQSILTLNLNFEGKPISCEVN